MYRILCVALLGLCIPFTLISQTPDTAGDSLVKADERLFDSTGPDKKDGVPFLDDLTSGGRLAFWRPKFVVGFERKNLMGLQDNFSLLKYNRADGLFIGLGSDMPLKAFLMNRYQGYLGFGYGFGSHFWQAVAGISRDFASVDEPVRVTVEGHIITDTQDAWKMNVVENSAYALFAGIDARDYYQRNGVSVGIQKFLNPRTSLKAEYRYDNYINSKREIGWSLFGPHQPFFEVPPIREGKMNSVVVDFLADYLTNRSWEELNLGAEACAEFGVGGNSFAHYVLDLRAKQSFFDDHLGVAVRTRFGSATAQSPSQKYFSVGGYGTLEGYPQNAYYGNRMTLIQTDVLLRPFTRIKVAVIFSNDFAKVRTADSTASIIDGLSGPASGFMYSPGIYIGSATGQFRMGASWRTDVYATPRFVLRFSNRF